MEYNAYDDENCYSVTYSADINRFETMYMVVVVIKNGYIDYRYSFNKDDIDRLTLLPSYVTLNSYENEIEAAKIEAAKKVPEGSFINEQEIRLMLDRDLNPVALIKTVCIDETGCHFVLSYESVLN